MSQHRAPAIAFAVLLFLVISFGVARWLTRENRERDAVLHVLRAQAAGDAPGVLHWVPGCADDPACRSLVESNVRRLRRIGDVKILNYESGTHYALAGATGPVRVAWDIGTRGDTVVQCLQVRRTGLGFLGGSVDITRVSAPIAREGSCPG